MKAKLFADHEEREIQRLSANIINHQVKLVELLPFLYFHFLLDYFSCNLNVVIGMIGMIYTE